LVSWNIKQDDCIITMSFTNNFTCGISLQHPFSGSVGICSHLAQLRLYRSRDLKSDNFAGEVYLNVVLQLQTQVDKYNDIMRKQCLNANKRRKTRYVMFYICVSAIFHIVI